MIAYACLVIVITRFIGLIKEISLGLLFATRIYNGTMLRDFP